jgi:hypothetical protein
MLAVLEAVDTPAAREVLGDVAKGSMLAPETRAAQAALTRL